MTGIGGRGGMISSKGPQVGLKPWAAAVRTDASAHGMRALPTVLPKWARLLRFYGGILLCICIRV